MGYLQSPCISRWRQPAVDTPLIPGVAKRLPSARPSSLLVHAACVVFAAAPPSNSLTVCRIAPFSHPHSHMPADRLAHEKFMGAC
jgi:hypothetical protein